MGTTKKGKTKKIKVTFLTHQPEVFDTPSRNVVYAKGRRAGGTNGAVHRLVEMALLRPGTRHLWVDTTYRNVRKLVANYFRPALKDTDFRWNSSDRVLTFDNGARCDFASANKPENIEGWGYDTIWVNEAGHVLKNTDFYYSTLLPMVMEAADPQLFFIGTPKGPGLFQRMFDWGQDEARPDWRSYRHSSFVNPLLNKEEIERLKEHLPEREYRQEVLAEFVVGEGAVFRNVEEIATGLPDSVPDPTAPYVIGADLARYSDFTVVWVGRADTRTGVFCDRFRRIPWRQQIERIGALSERFGHATIYADATGVGDAVCEQMQCDGLPVEEVVLTASRKRALIDSLAVAVERTEIRIVRHEQTLREMAAYEQTLLPSGHQRMAAPGSGHDDCVIALALCHWGMRQWGGDFIHGPNMVSFESID